MNEDADGDRIRNRAQGIMGDIRETALTVIRDRRQDLGLDVLKGETLPGATDSTLGANGLASLLRLNLRGIVLSATLEEVITALGVLNVLNADVDALPSDATTNL